MNNLSGKKLYYKVSGEIGRSLNRKKKKIYNKCCRAYLKKQTKNEIKQEVEK